MKYQFARDIILACDIIFFGHSFSFGGLKWTNPPNFFSAEMKLSNTHIKNLIILSVSGIFQGFKNWQKVAEICYQLVHDRVSRGLALFPIWRHRLIYMALTLCEHACKIVCDVKSGIDPCPSLARAWDKAYQISGCAVARQIFRGCIFAEIVFGVRCTLSLCSSTIC